jgi:hypothetical protein
MSANTAWFIVGLVGLGAVYVAIAGMVIAAARAAARDDRRREAERSAAGRMVSARHADDSLVR